jgi:hypothetical protein
MTHGSTCERMALRSCLHHHLPPPMGVRTVQAIDAARDGRPLTFELRYLAAECDAGRDVSSSSQGTSQVLSHWPPRWQGRGVRCHFLPWLLSAYPLFP